MEEALSALSAWIAGPSEATVRPLDGASGFSGARLWQVSHGVELSVLRRWPSMAGTAQRLHTIHGLQLHLANNGLPAPPPRLTRDGAMVHCRDGACWSLCRWMPGVADYWSRPTPQKLRSALMTLAQFHRAAAEYSAADADGAKRFAVSPAALHRADRMDRLRAGELERLGRAIADGIAAEGRLAAEALRLINHRLPSQRQAAHRWREQPLPLQWRLGDVWHDHILFTGEQVTGVIDYGAAGVDAPAGDVARLLGSLVGDAEDGWRQGLAAYEAVRPLSPHERDAARFFDASGTLLAAANWVAWLFPSGAEAAAPWDRPAAVDRLRRLVERLRFSATIRNREGEAPA